MINLEHYPITESSWTETRISLRLSNNKQIICSKVNDNTWDIMVSEDQCIAVVTKNTNDVDQYVTETIERWSICPK